MAGVPNSCLVWPRNWGSGKTTLHAATMPSWTSSLVARCLFSLASLANFRVSFRRTSLTARVRARSNPAVWVPPWTVGMVLTNDSRQVS